MRVVPFDLSISPFSLSPSLSPLEPQFGIGTVGPTALAVLSRLNEPHIKRD